MSEEETEEEMQRRLALEESCSRLGRTIGAQLPKGIGFTLLMFDFGGKGNFAYLSNAQRSDMIELLHEAIAKIGGDHG
jgi:hypothetical protein